MSKDKHVAITIEELNTLMKRYRLTHESFGKKIGAKKETIRHWIYTKKVVPTKASMLIQSVFFQRNDLTVPILEKDGVSFTLDEVALFVVKNEAHLMKNKVFENLIELRAKDKIIEILEKKR